MTSDGTEWSNEPGALCPDCKQSKHHACVGEAWDEENDKVTFCSCWARGHHPEPTLDTGAAT